MEPICQVLKLNQDVSRDHKRSNSTNLTSYQSHDLLLGGLHLSMSLLCLRRLQRAFQNLVYLRHRICRNEILQTNFGIIVRSIHHLHTHHIIFTLLELHFYLFDGKRVKYAENAAFDFPFLFEHQTKTIAKNQTIFLANKPSYQLSNYIILYQLSNYIILHQLSNYIMIMRLKCEVGCEKIQLDHLLGKN